MELVAALLVLYGLQCFVHLPNGSVLFVARARGGWISHGPGWRLAHPVPSRSSLIGERPPLVERNGALYGRGVAPRVHASGIPAPQLPFDSELRERVSVEGDLVRIGGRPLARTTSKRSAELVRERIASIAQRGPAGLLEEMDRLLESDLSIVRLSNERRRVRAHTRWLRAALNSYGFVLFIGLPITMGALGAESALWRGLPVLLALHLLCLVLFGLAERRIGAASFGDRVQALFELALYPPLLLRGFQRIESSTLGRFHPAALAVEFLEGESRNDFLRRELARAEQAVSDPHAIGISSIELRALEALVEQSGESLAALREEPRRRDPRARAYCPGCRDEYRSPDGTCTECRLSLRSF